MEVLDLTLPLHEGTRVFPGYTGFKSRVIADYASVGYYARHVCLEEHVGTHVDSPAHFVRGAPTVDELPPERFIARAVVLDFTGKKAGEPISRDEVVEAIKAAGAPVGPGWYVLIATGWDRVGDDVWLKYPYLEDDAARALADLGVWGIGLDTPSPDYEPFNVHRILLPKGVLIIENMARLAEAAGRGPVIPRFVLAPLPLKGGSGSPARALAVYE